MQDEINISFIKDDHLIKKFKNLLDILKEIESAILAFSGGVDSSFLLKALKLSGIRFIAVTSVSDTMPEEDLLIARRLAEELQINHILIEGRELLDEAFIKNDRRRCFYCKSSLFRELMEIKERHGYNFILDGSTMDDLSDYRPGLEAAKMLGIRSPLIEAGLYKEEIRTLSRGLGLSTWNRPSSPCLSSRIPYGTRITPERLKRIGQAERVLKALGFQVVRVRDYWPVAMIEITQGEFINMLEKRDEVIRGIKLAGYTTVGIDLEGYRQGKLNE
ncbi:MAG: ATP-dependent sacrificial sulfur transferase LarE [Thermodesulfovibrionales bacterium]|nr:ATP-dependent sacrificial sulfur transferase LarE [Thermodesulfovibrionales bacterium]